MGAHRSAIAGALAVVLALALASCQAPRAPAPRLILLYAPCTVNKHYLSPYAPEVAFTPRLGRFAREAVVFRRHRTEAGQSGTAFASIFTGTQADRHGVFRHPTRLGDEVETIGETFRRGGWDVVAWLEHGMASAELGYARGARASFDRKLTADDAELRRILDRLRQDPDYRALLITDFTVTHGPYQPGPVDLFCRRYPDACAARADRAEFDFYADFYRRGHAFLSYDFPATRERTGMDDERLAGLVAVVELLYRANVAYLDLLFGAVVDEVRGAGLWDESVIVFTADHGETLFRDGTWFKWTHGYQLAPEVLDVPLVVRAPGVAAGVWEGVTRSIDVFPTLAGLAGLAPPAGDGYGVDLAPALLGRRPPPELDAWSHTDLIAEPVLAASQRWTLFHSLYPRVDPELMWVELRRGDRVWQLRRTPEGEPEPAVFDLARDPWELANLYAPGADAAEFAELRRYRARLIAAWHEQAERREELDPQRQEELLKSLGYVD